MGQVSVLFMLILVGIIIRKMNIVTDNIYDELGNLVITVCMPAFILSAMDFDFSLEIVKDSGLLILLSFAVYGVSIILGEIFVRIMGKTGAQRDVYQYMCVFSNSGYMGYPVVSMIFGTKALFYTAIYNLSFSVLVWSYGVYVLTRSHREQNIKTKKEAIISGLRGSINPSMIAVFIGFSMFVAGIKFPAPVFKTIDIIGSATTPLSMMFIGFILSSVHPKELFEDVRDFILAAYRILILPFLVYIVLKYMGMADLMLIIPVVIAAMPASANSALIASKYKSDVRLASKLVFLTTFLSIFTIPIIAGMLS